jgi:hypothetical protein
MATTVRSVSFGRGVQSTALLVWAQERLDFDLFLFANVADDSEQPATLRYVRESPPPSPPWPGSNWSNCAATRGGTRTRASPRPCTGADPARVAVRPDPGADEQRRPRHRSCTADFKVRWAMNAGGP